MDGGELRIVVGLGNPGREYAATRHNMGFLVVDELARRHGVAGSRRRFRSEVAEGRAPWGRLVLAKPQTYMNESGLAVREIVGWYRQPLDAMLIVVDDLDLPFGQIRLRPSGSAGGHNGLKSIFSQLGNQAVPRLRVGIGRDDRVARARVLSRFSPEERAQLGAIVKRVADVIDLWAEQGIVEAMNVANVRPKPPRPPAGTDDAGIVGIQNGDRASSADAESEVVTSSNRGGVLRLLPPVRRRGASDG